MYRSLLILLFLATLAPSSNAQTIGGFPGSTPPVPGVTPAVPTTADIVEFRLVADGDSYSNPCLQLLGLGGEEFTLAVDDVAKTIQVGVTGTHSGACTAEFAPVTGLLGTAGPLTVGQWTISSSFGDTLAFTVVPEPTTMSLALSVLIATACTYRRR